MRYTNPRLLYLLYMTYYQSAIVTIALSCIISEIWYGKLEWCAYPMGKKFDMFKPFR